MIRIRIDILLGGRIDGVDLELPFDDLVSKSQSALAAWLAVQLTPAVAVLRDQMGKDLAEQPNGAA